MDKREVIREGIANILKSVGATDVPPEKWTLNILEFLDSQGVVIKVDRECQGCNGTGFLNTMKNGASTVCPVCMGSPKSVVVESLIKEE